MKKRYLIISILSIALLLSGCKKKPQHITVEELQGVWYAVNSNVYETISFAEEGYTTNSFLPDGTYQVNKEGLVKLIDKYRTIETLTPVLKNGEWVLEYEQLYSTLCFTREVVVPPETDGDAGGAQDITSDPGVRDVLLSTINQFLAGVEWETKSEEQVRYDSIDRLLTMDNRDPIKFDFTDARLNKDGEYIFFATSNEGTYKGVIRESPHESGDFLYEFTLYLNGDIVLVASKQSEQVILIDQ